MTEESKAKRRWEPPVVRRIDGRDAENGSLIGPEALILRS